MAARVGFCCKYLHPDQTQPKKVLMEIQQQRTEKCTTVAWLKRQTREVAEQRLYDIMTHNMQSAANLVEYVGRLEPGLRMVRLGSNQLPMYTQPDWFIDIDTLEVFTPEELIPTGFQENR